MKSMFYVSICLLLAMAMLLGGCGSPAVSEITARNTDKIAADPAALTEEANTAVTELALRLLKGCQSDGDTLISPTSILCALAMTANGAEGETLSQLEDLFGMSADELNAYMAAFLATLDDSDGSKLSSACSMWLRDDDKLKINDAFIEKNAGYYDSALKINDAFIEKNAGYYDSAVFTAPFDGGTLDSINSWVKKNTDGMIDRILDKIPDDAMLYLINAVAFDAKWQTVYTADQVEQGSFTNAAGEDRIADFMDSEEHTYISDGSAAGFIKYYQGGRYAFAALLPESGVGIDEYIAGLSGESLRAMLTGAQSTTVIASLPKFDSSYSAELSDVLRALGVTELFDPDSADLSGIGSYDGMPLYVSRVLHKCHVSVNEQGTKAGAATAVENACGSAFIEEIKYVTLNRPFLYMILDCDTMTPVFIGTVTDIG